MPNDTPDPQLLRRDGTSQGSREQAALAPEYVRVDERSYKDLLAFAQAYAKELRYYNAENQPMGDWRAFLPDDPALASRITPTIAMPIAPGMVLLHGENPRIVVEPLHPTARHPAPEGVIQELERLDGQRP
jgi:hypothetical protein